MGLNKNYYIHSTISPGNNYASGIYVSILLYTSGNFWLKKYYKFEIIVCRHTGINNANFAIQQKV